MMMTSHAANIGLERQGVLTIRTTKLEVHTFFPKSRKELKIPGATSKFHTEDP
jgi:hypothetical protein